MDDRLGMDDSPLFRITAVASTLAAGFACLCIIATTALMIVSNPPRVSIKLLGSLMILSLAFAANTGYVYLLAIFIVATLVTDLDFLEKIAALFWNRDKYWEYRLGKVSPAEKKARIANEAKQEVEAERSVKTESKSTLAVADSLDASSVINSFVNDALSFEKAVLSALKQGIGPFPDANVAAELKLRSPSGAIIIDAVLQTPSTDYIVEIKYSMRPHVLLNALAAAERGVMAYRAYLKERNILKEVMPVAIIPARVSSPVLFKESMLVLQFDSDEHRFVNEQEFLAAARAMRFKNA